MAPACLFFIDYAALMCCCVQPALLAPTGRYTGRLWCFPAAKVLDSAAVRSNRRGHARLLEQPHRSLLLQFVATYPAVVYLVSCKGDGETLTAAWR